MIYRPKMILWSGAQLWWWWWWWLVMMLKGCLLHKQSLKGLGVVQSCAFSKLLHGVCFRIGKHSIVGPSLYYIITHQQTQGCLCIYDQGELYPQGWGRGISKEGVDVEETGDGKSDWEFQRRSCLRFTLDVDIYIYGERKNTWIKTRRSLRWPVRRWR